MKLQQLDKAELQEVNGGSDGTSTTGIGVVISTDTLLSLDYSWSNGNDQSYQSSLQVGKGIHTGVFTNGTNNTQ